MFTCCDLTKQRVAKQAAVEGTWLQSLTNDILLDNHANTSRVKTEIQDWNTGNVRCVPTLVQSMTLDTSSQSGICTLLLRFPATDVNELFGSMDLRHSYA